MEALGQLRNISVPHGSDADSKIKTLNQRMDAAWKFFERFPDSLDVAAAELRKETAAPKPDQFFLLDVSNLLLQRQHPEAITAALAALGRIDASSEVIQANWEELFHCIMKVGASGKEPATYLTLVDRIYFQSQTSLNFFRAPHTVDLNASDIRYMVYGVAGDAAANHLAARAMVTSTGDRARYLELLSGLGSEAQTGTVKAIITAATDFETIARCVTVLMQVGGPAGRQIVLDLDATKLEPKAKDYIKRVQPAAAQVNFVSLTKALEQMGTGKLSDQVVQERLDKMEQRDGQDDETFPVTIARSGLPKDKLLMQLKRIRARSFRRESNHVFEDLNITNLLINAVQFK